MTDIYDLVGRDLDEFIVGLKKDGITNSHTVWEEAGYHFNGKRYVDNAGCEWKVLASHVGYASISLNVVPVDKIVAVGREYREEVK